MATATAQSLRQGRPLCSQCAKITTRSLRNIYSTDSNLTQWLPHTIGDLLRHYEEGKTPVCCLCAMASRALLSSNELFGPPGRRVALKFVSADRKSWTHSSRPIDGLDNDAPEKTHLLYHHIPVAGLGVFVEQAAGSGIGESQPAPVALRVHGDRRYRCTSLSSSEGSRDPIEAHMFSQPLYSDTWSALEVARDWLQDCLDHNDHDVCALDFGGKAIKESLSESSRSMPGRVIEILSNGKLRLVETGHRRGVYAALSYCWGNIKPDNIVKLTEHNIEMFKKDIPQDILPATIRDAALVARKLWIPYLWVDSLCIIQGNKDDWEREGACMAETYQNAIITLAVLGDRTSTTGFLDRKGPDLAVRIPHNVGASSKPKDIGNNIIVTSHLPLHADAPSHLEEEMRRSTWTTRAWTFQEHRLSRRILYFGENQLFWECHAEGRSEDRADDCLLDRNGAFFRSVYLEQGISEAALMMLRQAPRFVLDGDEGFLESNAWKVWSQVLKTPIGRGYMAPFRWAERRLVRTLDLNNAAGLGFDINELVQNYTSRKLSDGNDKLIAIEGLAKAISQQSNQEFFAGIFTNHIAKGLFWSSVDGAMSRPRRNRAPSWSWAAWDGRMRLCAPHWHDDTRRNDRDSNKDRNVLMNVPEMRGGRLGDLTSADFHPYNHTVLEFRGARPFSISLTGLAFQVERTPATCSVFSLTSAQLATDIKIWPKGYHGWESAQSHLLFSASPGNRTGMNEMNDLAQIERHHITEHPSSEFGRKLIGAARFDEPEKAPSTCTAILLWHYRDPTVIFSKSSPQSSPDPNTHDILSCKRQLKTLKIPHTREEVSWSNTLGQTTNVLPHRWKRVYFLLLVDRAVPDPTGKIQKPFRRIGVAIAYWIPGMEKFGGMDLKTLAEKKDFELV